MPDASDILHSFLCPISLDIMSDPVTVSTGHTFDRPSISAWISTGNSTCPVTRSPISSDLIPNLTLRRLIHHWCSFHCLSLSPTPPNAADLYLLRYLLTRSSPNSGIPIPARLAALCRLSRLVRDSDANRSLLSSIPETRGVLISILFSSPESESELRNESLVLLATCRLTESDCHSIASDTARVGFILGLMLEPNTIDVRAKATALIKAVLSGTTSPSLRSRIGAVDGLFDAVVAVIKDGRFFRRAAKVGVKALLELCLTKQNQKRAVAAGAAEALVDVVASSSELERGDVEAALATSELLCGVPEGCAAFAANGLVAGALVRTLLKVSESATEHAAGVLVAVCGESERARREAVEARVVTRLLLVVQSGATERGKRKAVALLKMLQSEWPKDEWDYSGDYVCNGVVPY